LGFHIGAKYMFNSCHDVSPLCKFNSGLDPGL
jgi:hypothetical protein